MFIYVNSVNRYVNCVEDFEEVIGWDGVRAINQIVETEKEKEDFSRFKAHNDDWEIIASNQSQQITYSYNMVDEIIDYINDTKRLDRKKLVSLLEEVKNQLDNY